MDKDLKKRCDEWTNQRLFQQILTARTSKDFDLECDYTRTAVVKTMHITQKNDPNRIRGDFTHALYSHSR